MYIYTYTIMPYTVYTPYIYAAYICTYMYIYAVYILYICIQMPYTVYTPYTYIYIYTYTVMPYAVLANPGNVTCRHMTCRSIYKLFKCTTREKGSHSL